ncbi:Uma2 family endonuclease [Crocosphaera sp. UHCC 0190]|uniref:Uma2 family endonuclease n=1 Tax=Crocosphaera sp. UHCC 0190 TaxID=3110246 RepID=UPI002B209C96|nr:Uma2 family endonuclease [Crocosphaera sp. UHCC 0190]MEA5510202.1 Uma2 family endonuclease [Crocosphaera sp. UHCC 0190]
MTTTQSIPKLLSFDDYINDYPDDGKQYQLIEGKLVEMMRPIGKHEEIGGFISFELGLEIRRLQLPYFIPNTAAIKPNRPNTGYVPDIIVLDREKLVNDTYWEKASSISLGISAKLVIEIVSSNWRDDYLKKFDDYEELGIKEYWIIDYLAKGSARYIGSPKEPTISIYQLINGEYQVSLFKREENISSLIFPELLLTAKQIFQAESRL